ncbi:Ig-like domain-containing protein [Cupriavidus sp. WS]|uniref:Ig-like domain-containing protein n=1 Tax=Cupriavidus sp. WS TaxID=1312922 RepID=UPI0018CB1A8F|nr:Ig-like domain-containing protein [Cupriavidus sp. WS]
MNASVTDGATEMSRAVAPSLTFSEGLDVATATASNVSLNHANGSAATSQAVAGTQLSVTPARALLPLTRYTLNIGTGLSSASGRQLAAPITLSFTTADGSWKSSQLIETNNAGDAVAPQIAKDGNGNALAVWYQFDGVRTNIWSNRYTAGAGWGTAQLVETDNAGDAGYPQVVMDAAGNALTVWYQYDGFRYNIWSNRYTAGAGWGTAQLIETDNAGSAAYPQIAMDTNGNALAVWQQSDGLHTNVVANRYTVGAGWGTPQLIETDNTGNAGYPQIAIDANGNALAAWHQHDGTRYNAWANRYTAGTGWGTAQLIETDNAGSALYPRLVTDAAGNALAVWYQSDGVRTNVWSNRYAAGTGWGTPQLIEADNAGDAIAPQIVMDRSGNALVVWYQSDGIRYNIRANRYAAGNWGPTAEFIETDNAGDAAYPQIVMDASGNALVVWQQSDGTRANIWSNRYVAGAGWGTAKQIETDNAGDALSPQIAVDASGNAMAVWQQSDGLRNNIQAAAFD